MNEPILRATACVALLVVSSGQAKATILPILPGDFSPQATVIDFETGSTMLPTVPGVTFVFEGDLANPPWFSSTGDFSGFFGEQGWSNLVSETYSDLALEFDTPVQAIGGWVGRIPNFLDEHPSQVVVELFDQSDMSLGFDTIDLPMAFDSPVFFGYSADAPIARLEIRGNNSGFFGADNVTFGSLATVPEPSSLALCGMAAFALIGRRSRHRRRMPRA